MTGQDALPGDQGHASAPSPDAAAGAGDRDDAGNWLSPAVASISAASFFSDAGHEISTSLLPGFLSSVLHSGPGALGIIEAAPMRWWGCRNSSAGR